jgi:hypothetical protein
MCVELLSWELGPIFQIPFPDFAPRFRDPKLVLSLFEGDKASGICLCDSCYFIYCGLITSRMGVP